MSTPRGSAPPVRTALAVLLATPVHLASVGILALGVWLLWPGRGVWSGALGVGCLLLAAWLVLPRRTPRRLRGPAGSVLDLDRSPATQALLGDVATAVGGRVPKRCVVTAGYGAVSRTGTHGRVLEVGAPLWLALDGEERVALLARALARRGSARSLADAYVARALWTLERWQELLTPVRTEDPDSVFDPIVATADAGVLTGRAESRLGADVVWLLLWPFRLVAAGYRRLLDLVADPLLRARDERAERAAAQAAGETAIAGLDRALADGAVVATVLQRATRTHVDLQTALSERTARISADRTAGAGRPGSVVVDLDDWARMDQEWAPAVSEQFAHVRSAYR